MAVTLRRFISILLSFLLVLTLWTSYAIFTKRPLSVEVESTVNEIYLNERAALINIKDLLILLYKDSTINRQTLSIEDLDLEYKSDIISTSKVDKEAVINESILENSKEVIINKDQSNDSTKYSESENENQTVEELNENNNYLEEAINDLPEEEDNSSSQSPNEYKDYLDETKKETLID